MCFLFLSIITELVKRIWLIAAPLDRINWSAQKKTSLLVGRIKTPLNPTHPLTLSPSAIMDPQQQFCLKWNSYTSNLAHTFSSYFKSESLADVTLFCGGKSCLYWVLFLYWLMLLLLLGIPSTADLIKRRARNNRKRKRMKRDSFSS